MSRTVKMLKYLVKIEGMKQCELAKRMGVKEASVSRWLGGKRQPSIDNVEKMARALGCEIRVVVAQKCDDGVGNE